MSWSSKDEFWDDRPAPPDAVGSAVVKHLLKIYTKYVGPRAKPMLQEELQKLGATPRTLRASEVADLIKMAARRLPDPGQRDDFISEALGDKK
jgi:hypothetical protein